MLQLKEIWVDACCPQLTDTWESSAYQRAIAVDALWLTFMRMLEPASRIKVRHIICTDSFGESPLEASSVLGCPFALCLDHACMNVCKPCLLKVHVRCRCSTHSM